MNRFIFILLFSIFSYSSVVGQEADIYELLTEPSLSRPLTLHKGFLQIYGDYSHHLGNNYFDATGSKLPFQDLARSVTEDNYQFDISYGLMEFLEIAACISYRNRYESEPTYIIDNRPGIGKQDRTFHTQGISNLDLSLKYRLPEFIQGFDMFISGGILTPVSSQYPDKPSHSIKLLGKDPGSSYQVQYEYNPASGSPAMFYTTGVQILFAWDKIGLSFNTNIQNPISEIETYSWVTRRYLDEFAHKKIRYYERPKGRIIAGGHVLIQAYPWFAVNVGYNYFQETPGWSDITGQTVSLSTSSSGFINAGFEIQVSTHLRIIEQIYIPIHGSNLYSEFSVKAGLKYNIVPLKNLYY